MPERSSAGSVEPDELEALISDRSASRAADAILKEFVVTRRGGDPAQASLCPRCKEQPADKALLGSAGEGHICGDCWTKDRDEEDRAVALPSTTRDAPCAHEAIIGLDGMWHCQKCGDAIDMAVAQSSPLRESGK